MGWVEVLTAAVGVVFGAAGGYAGARASLAKSRRDEGELLIEQYDRVIALKMEAREELERQLVAERDENRRLEQKIRQQSDRIDRLEDQMRDLITSAMAAGACAAAPTCPTHVPIAAIS